MIIKEIYPDLREVWDEDAAEWKQEHRFRYARRSWKLVSSRVVPFYCYGEEKEFETPDIKHKVSFTREGWLEQMWEAQKEAWWGDWVSHEEYMQNICL